MDQRASHAGKYSYLMNHGLKVTPDLKLHPYSFFCKQTSFKLCKSICGMSGGNPIPKKKKVAKDNTKDQ